MSLRSLDSTYMRNSCDFFLLLFTNTLVVIEHGVGPGTNIWSLVWIRRKPWWNAAPMVSTHIFLRSYMMITIEACNGVSCSSRILKYKKDIKKFFCCILAGIFHRFPIIKIMPKRCVYVSTAVAMCLHSYLCGMGNWKSNHHLSSCDYKKQIKRSDVAYWIS